MRSSVRPISLFAARALLVFFAMSCAPAMAHAHAMLVASSPGDNAILATAPREAVLRFNSRIEKEVARVALETGSGRAIPLPPVAPDTGGPDSLIVPLPPLPAGSYRLSWRVLATDGHATPGMIRFTITGGGAQ